MIYTEFESIIRSSIYNLLVLFNLKPSNVRAQEMFLSRCACMGNDVQKILRTKYNFHSLNAINYQKLRVDGFTSAFTTKVNRLGFFKIVRHIPRRDIQLCVSMQSNRIFLKKYFKPRYIFLDDFSELTDSEFLLRNTNYNFYSSVGDLEQNFRASGRLDNLGLIEEDKLTQIYDKFFAACFSRWPDTKIFFMHFPTKLDDRTLYKNRGRAIRNSISFLSAKYPGLSAFDCPDELVGYGDEVDATLFPYHYSKPVYDWFARQISQEINSLTGR